MLSWNRCHWIVAITGQGIAPWHAALTNSDLVAVTNAPVTVQLVLLLRPVVCLALMSCCSINEVASDWTCQNAEGKSPDNDGSEGVLGFDHGLSPCVWCLSPLEAIGVGGFDPPAHANDLRHQPQWTPSLRTTMSNASS